MNPRVLTSHVKKFRKNRASIPNVGDLIECDVALIRQDEPTEGRASTPMGKIRYIDGCWQQVRPNEAGMYVFFNQEPTVLHTHFKITCIIPSKVGCYADLL